MSARVEAATRAREAARRRRILGLPRSITPVCIIPKGPGFMPRNSTRFGPRP